MKKTKNEFLWAVAFLLVTAMLIGLVSAVLRPAPRTTYGSTWNAFLAEPENSLDVIWLGSSFAYCDVNPAVVYENSGLTGFVMAGGEQPLSITYWYLKEIFKTQSPSMVILEGTGLYFEPYQNYTLANVSVMPASVNKLGAIFTASEPELRTELLFSLAAYHDRWKTLGVGDIKKLFAGYQWDAYKGFTPMEGSKEGAGETVYEDGRYVDPQVYTDNMAWLGKILALCEERGVQSMVVFHPSYTRFSEETAARMGQEIQAISPNTIFCNWGADFERIGLTPTQHIYDAGHLNQAGAEVFSAWLGKELNANYGVTPRTQTSENAAAWQLAVEHWKAN